MRNFGVTSPVWDRLLSTYDEPGVVTVPRRMAPAWLLDEYGEVRPEFAEDYELVGAVGIDDRQREIDRVRAFASQAPTD